MWLQLFLATLIIESTQHIVYNIFTRRHRHPEGYINTPFRNIDFDSRGYVHHMLSEECQSMIFENNAIDKVCSICINMFPVSFQTKALLLMYLKL